MCAYFTLHVGLCCVDMVVLKYLALLTSCLSYQHDSSIHCETKGNGPPGTVPQGSED